MTAEPFPPPLAELLALDHRRLDDLFGRFLTAMGAKDTAAETAAIRRFDHALRLHTALEEEHLFPAVPGQKLVAAPGESDREHVQIREVSGMMARLLVEKNDLPGARALAGNLARRWDAHTTREEKEAYPLLTDLDPAGEAAVRDALGGQA